METCGSLRAYWAKRNNPEYTRILMETVFQRNKQSIVAQNLEKAESFSRDIHWIKSIKIMFIFVITFLKYVMKYNLTSYLLGDNVQPG